MASEIPSAIRSVDFDLNKVTRLLNDIEMVADLLIYANDGDLLKNTISNAGWFIQRSADEASRLVQGGES